MKKIRKIVCGILTMALVMVMGMNYSATDVYAASTVTGNNTKATAYNCGSWSSINSLPTVILYADQQQSWFKFTVAAGEKIYVRVSSQATWEGTSVQVQDASGNEIDKSINSRDLIYSTSVTPALYVNIDNTSSSTKTFYVVVDRGNSYTKDMYYSLSADNRIRTGSGTFSFSGTASNSGNKSLSLSGVDSTIISLNLTNSTSLPKDAIVTSIRTSGTQSPSQGNVHHKIRPASTSTWYTSTVSSAKSGSYNINVGNGFKAKQTWYFRYNALATAKSTMKNVKITIEYQYDLANTDYKIFTK